MALQWAVSTRSVDSLVYSAETTVEVPYGQMTNIVLPDGTIVNLNSGSRLSYSSGYGSGKRVVALQGEAFFHVTTDKEHPFLIKTNKLDFRVYGTSFNVEAYPEDDFLNTTLVEGSLGVLSKNGKEHTRLKPGENFQYLENEKKMEVKKVDITTYTSWKNGLVTFRNESLENIARKIERWYNVEIIIKNSKLKEELYLGTIMKNKPVDQILEVLHLTSSLNYTTIMRPDQPTLIYWE